MIESVCSPQWAVDNGKGGFTGIVCQRHERTVAIEADLMRISPMVVRSPKLKIKSKVWIEDEDGKVVFGAGRLRILKEIEAQGSILGASKALGMSYRAVWGKIKATEQRLGRPILEKQIGGQSGGGSTLTPFARTLMQCFLQLESSTGSIADALFSGLFANIGNTEKSSDVEKPVKII